MYFVYGIRYILAFQLIGLLSGEVKSGLVWAQCSIRGQSVG